MGLSVYFKNVLFAEKQDILLKIVRNNVMIFKQIKNHQNIIVGFKV